VRPGNGVLKLILFFLAVTTTGSLSGFAQQLSAPSSEPLIGFMSPSGRVDDVDTSPQESSAHSPADSDTQHSGLVMRSIKRTLRDQGELYAAPFHKQNLKWDALFLIGTGGLIAADRHIRKALPDSPLGAYHALSAASIVSLSVASGGLFVLGRKNENEHAKEAGDLTLEALVNTFLIYAPMQVIAGRERPDEGTGNGRFRIHDRFNSSFPGGHSMFSFTMATVIAHEYPKPWVQVAAYGAATAVTAGRLLGRNHFSSDLFVGSILGYLIGTHIFHAHCKMGLSPSCHNDNSALMLPEQPYELGAN
jgi:membrane-associated phospholipid phosphatase